MSEIFRESLFWYELVSRVRYIVLESVLEDALRTSKR